MLEPGMADADAYLRQVVFVQHSTHLAGAQKSLSRLLTADGLSRYHPVLLTAEEGWLTRFCTHHGVPWVCTPFPSPRSVQAMWLGGNKRFAMRAVQSLRSHLLPGRQIIVHANDHPDSLIGLSLADVLGARTVLTLRTPGMTSREFFKHGGARQERVVAVGEELAGNATKWLAPRAARMIHNGVTDDEILPPSREMFHHDGSLLVLGSLSSRKGWQDMVEALLLLEQRLPEQRPLPEICFLGDLLGQKPHEKLGTSRLRRFRTNFIGVVEDYRTFLRGYALAVHPSRSESFGMAALECVAAGVPLLAAATGVIPQFIPSESFLYPPADATALADRLFSLLSLPTLVSAAVSFDMAEAQSRIRASFSTRSTVAQLSEIYDSFEITTA